MIASRVQNPDTAALLDGGNSAASSVDLVSVVTFCHVFVRETLGISWQRGMVGAVAEQIDLIVNRTIVPRDRYRLAKCFSLDLIGGAQGMPEENIKGSRFATTVRLGSRRTDHHVITAVVVEVPGSSNRISDLLILPQTDETST